VERRTVWILNHYCQEPTGTGPTRHYTLAKYLKALGWDAQLVGASVEHATGRRRLEGMALSREECIDGVQFLWLRTPRYRGNGLARTVNMVTYATQAVARVASRLPRPDVVVGSSVHPLAAWAAAVLAKRHRVPFVFEVRDLWPQTLIEMGRVAKGSATERVLRLLERSLYRRASSVVGLMPGIVEYVASLGVPGNKVVWIPNGVDMEAFPELPRPPTGKGDTPFTLMYFGAHGEANGLDTLLDAMAIVERNLGASVVHCRLVGEGGDKSRLQVRARELDLRSVSFEAGVPRESISHVAAEAHAFVLCTRDLPGLYRYGVSMNKLYEYMALGRPVVLAMSALNDPIRDSGAGITVPPDDPRSLAEAIEQLAHLEPEERRRLGAQGRRWVSDRHGYAALARRFAEVLDGVLERGGQEGPAAIH